jgi:uncharacterized hydantoinase/oxoprolinase family protein
MGGVIGLDVGGANTKAVWRNGNERRALSRPFEVWRDREALAAVLREVVAGVAPEPVDAVALTTTAELSDAFRTKREGVGFVLDAAEAALGGPELLAFTTAGEVVSFAEARARAPEVAAANWLASALAVAHVYPDALMIDVGSTTADAVAAFLDAEQVRQIEAAVRRVRGRLDGDPPVVPLGAGAFLAREAAERLGRAVVELPWSAAEGDAAPAAALAELLAGRGC